METTFALIKPDATSKPWLEERLAKEALPDDAPEGAEAAWAAALETRSADKSTDILARIEKAGFRVVAHKMTHLTKAEAEAFYAEHAARPFFEALTAFMSSGAVVALVLEKANAVAEWRALMGATNSLAARAAAEAAHPLDEDAWPLRALFGTDGTRNATHGSDSAFSAFRETAFFFPELDADGWERSVAVVLPAALAHADAAVAAIEDAGFHIAARASATLTREQAAALGAAGDAALDAATAGPALALLVERRGAVKHLRVLGGNVHNGTQLHARALVAPSADARDACRGLFPDMLPIEATLAVVKPGTSESDYRAIVAEVRGAGFTVLAETRRTLSKEEAEIFYAEHKGRPFFEALTAYMSSGSVVALALAKPGAIRAWRLMQGPTNTAVARRDAPASLRARFGVDGTRNATHGSDSPAAASRELRFYFPTLPLATDGAVLGGDSAIDYLKTSVVATVFAPAKGHEVSKTLEAVVIDALAELARAKPSSEPAEAIRWLGQWLLDNNPRRGVAAEGAATRGPVVVEPDDEPREPREPRSRALARGAARKAAGAAGAAGVAGAGVSSARAGAGADGAPARTIVFVLGAPGAGKGTQCEKIAAAFGYTHLSTGDLLRAEVASGSALGAELAAIMAAGELVSTSLVLRLVSGAMAASGAHKFLLDGYPRALDQAVQFEAALGAPAFVLAFDADEATLEARLVKRGETSGRADDNVESIRKRFATFRAQSEAVIDFYGRVGLLRRVDALRPVDAVFDDAAAHFRPQCVWMLGGPGSGRTTQAARVAAEGLGWTHLSSGALMRAEVARGTPLGAELDTLMRRGDVVPADTTVRLVRDAIEAAGPTGRFILDGVPADMEQALALDRAFGAPLFVVSLVAPDAVLLARLMQRKDGGRGDEHSAVHKRALQNYHESTAPVAELYAKQARVRVVDAAQAPDAVFAAVRAALLPSTVFVLGAPGSGKATQAARLAAEFGYLPLSTGDLLRAEVERGSADGAAIAAHLAAGTLVPLATTVRLLATAMAASRARRVLVSGFPRAVDQAAAFAGKLGAPDFALFFDCPEEDARARLLRRGAGASARGDDGAAAVAARHATFVAQALPVISALALAGKVRAIDATPPPATVYESARACFLPTVALALGAPGSGKATQAARLAAEFDFTVLNTGDLLRAEVARGTPLGERVAATLAAGALVDDAVAVTLLREAMAGAASRRFLLHGFPRTAAQAAALEAAIGRPAIVLHFDVPRAVSAARLAARGKAAKRADDLDAAAVAARLDAHAATALPVIRTYDALRLVRTVPAAAAPDAVYARARAVFLPQFVALLGEAGDAHGALAERAGRELGYATLDALALFAAEEAAGTPAGRALAAAAAARRTPPLDAALAVLRKAVAAAPGTPRFLVTGFPRVVSQGFPGVHDQVMAAEAALGAFKGAVAVTASLDARCARAGAAAPGEVAAVRARADAFRREQAPVAAFFGRLEKLCSVDTSELNDAGDAAFEAARPFLE
jgi:adenylate kinase